MEFRSLMNKTNKIGPRLNPGEHHIWPCCRGRSCAPGSDRLWMICEVIYEPSHGWPRDAKRSSLNRSHAVISNPNVQTWNVVRLKQTIISYIFCWFNPESIEQGFVCWKSLNNLSKHQTSDTTMWTVSSPKLLNRLTSNTAMSTFQLQAVARCLKVPYKWYSSVFFPVAGCPRPIFQSTKQLIQQCARSSSRVPSPKLSKHQTSDTAMVTALSSCTVSSNKFSKRLTGNTTMCTFQLQAVARWLKAPNKWYSSVFFPVSGCPRPIFQSTKQVSDISMCTFQFEYVLVQSFKAPNNWYNYEHFPVAGCPRPIFQTTKKVIQQWAFSSCRVSSPNNSKQQKSNTAMCTFQLLLVLAQSFKVPNKVYSIAMCTFQL